jgi:hypothetical protein
MIYRLEPHSVYNQYTTEMKDSTNTSTIIDRLIRLAAKLTESFASDIIYDIEDFKSAVEKGDNYNKLLAFDEQSIWSYDVTDDKIDVEYKPSALQWWRLEWNPQTTSGKLERVRILY